MPNLDLIQALNNNKYVVVPVTSAATNKATVEDATTYWLRAYRSMGYVIVTIEIALLVGILWETAIDKSRYRHMGLLRQTDDWIAELAANQYVLVILERDSETPYWVSTICQNLAQGAHSKWLILDREHRKVWKKV